MLYARKFAGAALTACFVTMGGVGATVLPAGAAQAAGCPTSSQIVTDINTIASTAGALNAQLGSLNPTSNPSTVRSAAQSTVASLNTMSNEFGTDTGTLSGCPALSSADSQTVANAFDGLANATNQMLSSLIGDHSAFAQFGQTAPIANSLRSLEASFDSYGFALRDVAPSQQGAITDDIDSVQTSLGNAISRYEQLCIPSPLYPAVPPVCVAL